MATALEIAARLENRKLARHGLGPNGQPPARARPESDERDEDEEEDDPPRQQQQRRDEQDSRDQEIADLKAQLQAANGRVAPAQSELSTTRQMLELERQARADERTQLQARIEAMEVAERDHALLDVESLLTEDERRDIDPAVLRAAGKIASEVVKRAMPRTDIRAEVTRVIGETDAQKLTRYKQEKLNTGSLAQLRQLSADPEFQKWSEEDDNDIESVISSLLNATSTEQVDRYVRIATKRIGAFREKAGTRGAPTAPDPRTALGGHMRRRAPGKITPEERAEKLQEAKTLARSHKPEDRKRAREILDQLE